MATKLTESTLHTTTGVKAPTMGKFPEGYATFSASVAGGTPTATVTLRAWNKDEPNKEVLATFVLPVPAGPSKAGDLFDSLPVYSVWDNWDWNVTALGAGATLRLSCVGVGV